MAILSIKHDEESVEPYISLDDATRNAVEICDIKLETKSLIDELLDRDQYLYEYFFSDVLPLVCPFSQTTQSDLPKAENISLILTSGKAGKHYCLGISALHLKATTHSKNELLDYDILRHSYRTIVELQALMERDICSSEVLQTVLSIIILQCSVGRPTDCLLDIPWYRHFHAATALLYQLDLELSSTTALASWIDILGATLLARSPAFIDGYRQRRIERTSSGLAQLMGCEDRVMYVIAEIADLEASIAGIQNKLEVTQRIMILDLELSSQSSHYPITEEHAGEARVCPSQPYTYVTALFQTAARIYLRSICPAFSQADRVTVELVDEFSDVMGRIQYGPDGFDRFLAWPLLIAGSSSNPNSSFRKIFAERADQLGKASEFGSFGKVRTTLLEMWRVNDESLHQHGTFTLKWRDIMRQNGWNFLVI